MKFGFGKRIAGFVLAAAVAAVYGDDTVTTKEVLKFEEVE